MARHRRSLRERFFENVMPEPNSGCWLWMGSTKRGGYGQISAGGRGGKNLSAHRVALDLHGRRAADDLVVRHRCDNPACVNPDHLLVGTQADNIADMWRRGRAVTRAGHTFKKRPEDIRRGKDHWNWGTRKSHCKHGHPLDGDNVIFGSDGHRRCRECHNKRSRLRMARLYHQSKRSKNGSLSITEMK